MIKSSLLRRILKFIGDLFTPFGNDIKKWERKNFWLRLAGLKISPTGVVIGKGFQCIDGLEENINIDQYAAIGHNLSLWNFNDIYIGKFSMIAAGVTISNGWHDKSSFQPTSSAVHIEPGCWIGVNATIIGGVRIGSNSIVGAGALVNKDVPPNSIVVGVPARVIGVRQVPPHVWHFGDVYYCPRSFKLQHPIQTTILDEST